MIKSRSVVKYDYNLLQVNVLFLLLQRSCRIVNMVISIRHKKITINPERIIMQTKAGKHEAQTYNLEMKY